ncbi:MAG: 4a-hydroxytetrahydrobiopterin dehydratase [Deltaproteobacteria bacterium]|nr:4a-hydroxytetrahydrobiopterin dehydratase [Deltaproteobacteria bacterium]
MSGMSENKCEPCREGSSQVTEKEMQDILPQIPEWEIVDVEGIKRLKRTFFFDDFAKALNFTNRVGAIAEEEGHHPEIITGWGKVTVSWWTHKIKGLHVNDFVMAAKTDGLIWD